MAAANGGLSPAEVYAPPQRSRGSRIPTLLWLLLVLAAAAGGWYVGHEVMHDPINFGSLGGKTALTEAQLDNVMATYTVGDEVFEVTAREAIAQQSSLEAAKNSDGTYATPSTESVLAAARTAVLMREVESKGITVSDEELAAYMQETFGTDDLPSLASAYTMDEETARARLKESAALAKLRKQVVSAPGDAPTEPAVPADDERDKATEDYAAYIIGLAGDEWNGETGTWASQDGPFATALHDYDVQEDQATYEAATTAYNVAYQLYSGRVTSANTEWTAYVNAILDDVQIAVCTLGS